MPSMLTASEKDKATARRFLDGCYEDAVRLPSQAQMERLIALGWVERVPGGLKKQGGGTLRPDR